VGAHRRNGPVESDSSENVGKLCRWCRIRPVVSDWYVGRKVGFCYLTSDHQPFVISQVVVAINDSDVFEPVARIESDRRKVVFLNA
jgi:hypothetical protein